MTARRLGLLAGCLLLLGLAALAGASPPPSPLCSVCGDALDDRAGGAVTVEESTATVRLHEDGSATWTVRNRFASAEDAERLADSKLLSDTGSGTMGDARLVDASAEDRTVVARYEDPEFAAPAAGGALVTGAFTPDHGYRGLDGLGADELTVVAPEGKRVGWAPPGASVSDDGQRLTVTDLRPYGFAAFVPRGALPGTLVGIAAVADLVLPAAVDNALATVPLQAAALGAVVGLVARPLVRLAVPTARVRPAAPVATGALGGAALVVGLLAHVAVPRIAPLGWWFVGTGLGGLTVAASLHRQPTERVDGRPLAGAAVGAVAVAAAGAALLGAALGLTEPLRALPEAVGGAALLAFLPAGALAVRGRRAAAAAVVALGLAVALAVVVPFRGPQFGWVILAPFGLAAAVVFALAGLPLALLGGALGDPRPPEREPGAGPAPKRPPGEPDRAGE